MKRLLAILLACSAVWLAPQVAGQGSTETTEALPDSPIYGVYPIGYREIIKSFLETRLLDAASAQIEWGKPQQSTIKTPEGTVAGYAVVITVNSRNKFGMYTGKQKYQLVIRNGDVVHAGRVKN